MKKITLEAQNGQRVNVTLRAETETLPAETTGAWYGVADETEFLGQQRYPKSLYKLIEPEPEKP